MPINAKYSLFQSVFLVNAYIEENVSPLLAFLLFIILNDRRVIKGDWFSLLPPAGYGMMTDGTTTFVNASACTVNFLPMNAPIVFDLPNPRTT